MPETLEKRRAPRCPVSLFVCRGERDAFFGVTRDVSTTGIFVKTSLRPEVGTTDTISFVWNRRALYCDAKVVRHDREGIGMEFLVLPQTAQEALQDLTHKLASN